VEYCYGDTIDADEAYVRYVWVMAYICYKFKLDPKQSIVGHFFLDPKRKTDPLTGLAQSRRTYDQLLKDVATEYDICTGKIPAPPKLVRKSGTARVTVKVNIRRGEPNTKAPVVGVLMAGAELKYVGYVENGENINGNAKWFKEANGNYFWSGAVLVA